MTQLPWHEYSRGETADDLFARANTHRTDSLVVAFETALGEKAATLGLAALSQPEQDVLAIEALEREVNNGGYAQFFINSSNEYAGAIVDALQRIGCPNTAAITERALLALPRGTARTPEALSVAMETENSKGAVQLEDCDTAYYASGEDIAGALLRYLLRRRESVRLA